MEERKDYRLWQYIITQLEFIRELKPWKWQVGNNNIARIVFEHDFNFIYEFDYFLSAFIDIYQNISYQVTICVAKKNALNRLSYIYFIGVPIEVRRKKHILIFYPSNFWILSFRQIIEVAVKAHQQNNIFCIKPISPFHKFFYLHTLFRSLNFL